MRRKLIKQGLGALTLSLPKKWCSEHHLMRGQEVGVDQDEEKLVIRPLTPNFLKKTTISVSPDSPQAYRSLLASLYRGGYDEVLVRYGEKKCLPHLQEAVTGLSGCELYPLDEQQCLVKAPEEGGNVDLEEHVQRIVRMLGTMKRILMRDVAKGKKASSEEMRSLRLNVLKQRDYLLRQVQKRHLFADHQLPYYAVSLALWQVARNLFLAYEHAPEIVSPRHLDLFGKSADFTIDYVHRLRPMNQQQFLGRHEEYDALKEEVVEELGKAGDARLLTFGMSMLLSVKLAHSSAFLLNH